MRPSKDHYVTSCQQLLALGAVLAVLTPAASIISLDVVREAPASQPSDGAGSGHAVELSAYTREASRTSRVPTAPVDAELAEYALTGGSGLPAGARGRQPVASRTVAGGDGTSLSVLSRPEPVVGYGGVGVTWDPGAAAADDELSFQVRTRTGGTWSAWQELEYHDEHAPDPDSPEGRQSRPGTDVLFVGRVDDVQVRADVQGLFPPAGMRMAVISPGRAADTEREAPAIDTGDLPSARTSPGSRDVSAKLAAFTPKPTIYSRSQWGANENLRDKGSLRYFEVHAGFVHHTVNANDYTRAEVPGLLRSIYAYHTQSLGWSDVGYNYLVDRFGRIWEGRAGGVDRPVVGAHTLGYNDYAFAMSAIGNFDIVAPSNAMVQAYGALFAWKLSLHGIDASSPRQVVGPDDFPAVNGHRDAGSTACPGRYLYAKLDQIRSLAKGAQQDWSGRELRSDLAGSEHPDLIVRRASDGMAFVLPTGGLSGLGKPVVSSGLAAGADTLVATPDVTGDGEADLLVRRTGGTTELRPGNGAGGFGAVARSYAGFADRDLLTATGDLDGDGHHDLVARDPATGQLNAYLGSGDGRFTRRPVPGDWSGYSLLAATGDLNGDDRSDLLARSANGALWAMPGTGNASFGTAVRVAGSWNTWGTVSGAGDFNRDGLADLVVRTAPGAPAWILPSRGDLSFGVPLGPVNRLKGAGTLVGAAQYAGDGLPDVVSRRGSAVRTYPNLGGVDLLPPIRTGVNLSGANVVFNAGDWDRDGNGDMIYRNRKGVLLLRTGDGDGGFGGRVRLGRGFGQVRLLAAVGDMTGDGWPDLMGQPAGSSMRIYPGNGGHGLGASYVAHTPIDASRQVPVGRWDTDGAPDSLFRTGNTLSLYPGNGPGGLTGARKLGVDVSAYDWVIGVSDLRVSGHSDVIVREKETGLLYALQATATKGFTSRRILGEGMMIYDLAG
ncbi:MAG: FG-GAP-like repeat-containing protein [Nocardioides sp.]